MSDVKRKALEARLAQLSPEQRALLLKRLAGGAGQPGGAAAGATTAEPELAPVPRDRPLPLSFAQQRLWFVDQFEGSTATYNVPSPLRLVGALDQAALERALADLVLRHEPLRTTFHVEGDDPVQRIAPPAPVPLEVLDLAALPPAERYTELRREIRASSQRPLDLKEGPVFRARLIRIAEKEHVLDIVIHHIATDGWSSGVLWRDLTALYRAHARGEAASLTPLPVQYADYAVWHRQWLAGERLEKQLAYWKTKLAGIAPLELPTSRQRPAILGARGGSLTTPFSASLVRRLEQTSRGEGATLFMTMFAAFSVLMHRYSNQDDVPIGAAIANRPRTELEALVGFFVNSLVMRCDLSGAPTVREVIARTRALAMDAYANQDVPFDRLVEELHPQRDLSRSPLFQVMFELQNTPEEHEGLEGLRVETLPPDTGTAKFELTISVSRAADGTASAYWEYNADLFEHAFVERLVEHYRILLEAFTQDLDAKVGTLPMLTDEERTLLVETWNDTKRPYRSDVTLHQLFEEQAARTPDDVAVLLEGAELTYRDLDARANQVAHYLRAEGVGIDQLVGISAERSFELVVGLLGILKAGAAYVPLDPEYPRERVAFMIEDADVSMVLTQARLRTMVTELAGRARVVTLDDDWAETIAPHPTTPTGVKPPPDALAYVIFTSGSTGRPKAAMNTHRAICNRLAWQQDTFRLTGADRVLHKAAIGFDLSVWELFWPLLNGARLVLARPGGQRDLPYQVDLIREQGITLLHLMPPVIPLFVDLPGFERCGTLRHVVTGGEASPFETQQRFFARSSAALANCYGPSECAVDVTGWMCERSGDRGMVPIGRPLANVRLFIVDKELGLVPAGVPGELYIGGVAVGRGYHRRPELTAEKFIPDPFSGVKGARLYRTGDLVRYQADGNIEFLGRIDNQVKLRGFRIELGEIESTLTAQEGVRSAIVLARSEGGEKRLVAYIVAESGGALDVEALKIGLRRTLPDHMVPSTFVFLGVLPLSPTGKVDRRSLPPPTAARDDTVPFEAPRTEIERVLADIWIDLLRVPRVGVNDNFFDLGGHSLLGIRLIARIRQRLAIEVPVRVLFEAPKLGAFAERVEACAPATASHVERLPRGYAAVFPLSYEQETFWRWEHANPGTSTWNASGPLRLHGPLEIDVLQRTLIEVVRRHESLRTTFPLVDGKPVQRVAQTIEEMTIIDLRQLDAATREAELARMHREDVSQLFDLERGPLFRRRLVRLSDDDHVLFLETHHLILGGSAYSILHREIDAIYDAFRRGEPCPLPELPFQYADYAVWERREINEATMAERMAFWRRKLEGVAPTLMPTERVVPESPSRSMSVGAPFEASSELVEGLQAVGKRDGATLFMVLLAALQVLLHRRSGQEDIVVGGPSMSGFRPVADVIDSMIANFTSHTVARTQLSAGMTFRELLARNRDALVEASGHELPIVLALPSASPLDAAPLRIVFNYTPPQEAPAAPAERSPGHVRMEGFGAPQPRRHREPCFIFLMWSAGTGLGGRLAVPSATFDAAAAANIVAEYSALLASIVSHPDQKLGRR